MYRSKRIVITICARGGSKAVPRKNIRELLGKPVIVHSIIHAQNFPGTPRIVVSTDDEEIRHVVEAFGIEVPFLRPPKLALDTSSKIPAMIHAVKSAEKYWNETYDIVVDLDPTNPMREVTHITDMVDMLIDMKETSVVFSVTEAAKNPYFNMVELDKNGYAHVSKYIKHPETRQQAPMVYSINSSIYVLWKDVLYTQQTVLTDKTRIYKMSEESSMEIDRPIDFEFMEFMMKKKRGMK